MTPALSSKTSLRATLDPDFDAPYLSDDVPTSKKIEINLKRNKKQDKSAVLDEAGASFRYDDAKHEKWNPERFALLYGTPLYDGADERQRTILNQLYWVAYYSQIISAEIATIFFNQTSAAGLYGVEEFRPVCDMLDLESAQERAHIATFRAVSDQVEAALFGERVFTYRMRTPYEETMIFPDTNALAAFWKRIQLSAFNLLSSYNAFIGCQYFLIRGLRTLNGKIVQHQLSQHFQTYERPVDEGGVGKPQDGAPAPSKISYWHFCDESYHFNSSTIVSHDVLHSLPAPTAFERFIVNLGIAGAQKDHRHYSTMVNGIFWYDPSGFSEIYKVLRSPAFGFDDEGAKDMLVKCFGEENESFHAAQATHDLARESYVKYLTGLDFITPANREMHIMRRASVARTLARNQKELARRLPALSSTLAPRALAAPMVSS